MTEIKQAPQRGEVITSAIWPVRAEPNRARSYLRQTETEKEHVFEKQGIKETSSSRTVQDINGKARGEDGRINAGNTQL